MSIPGAASPLFLATTAGAAAGFEVSRSLRFNSGDSSRLTRTFSAGNRKVFTISLWAKKSQIGSTYEDLFGCDVGGEFRLIWEPNGNLEVYSNNGSITTFHIDTVALFRDPSAWYHFVVSVDATNTSVKFYVNGVELTDFVVHTAVQNADTMVNSAALHTIGSKGVGQYFNGYLAEINFIDGQALAPTDFGEFDDNGVWQAKEFAGFNNPNNGTVWTNSWAGNLRSNGLYGPDDAFDGDNNQTYPSHNYNNNCTWTPPTPFSSDRTIEIFVEANANWPVTVTHANNSTTSITANGAHTITGGLKSIKLTYASSGVMGSSSLTYVKVDGYTLLDGVGDNSFRLPFTDNSTTQALGYDAAVTAPTLNPKGGMDVVTYTGNGGTQSISSLAFQPDFVWIKQRSGTYDHAIFDSVRGALKRLRANQTNAEGTDTTTLTSFNTNGFTTGSDDVTNKNSSTYVAWCWKAGGAAVSNTDGTITSQVSASTDYGFSVCTFTSPASGNFTFGHGLSTAPSLVFMKDRENAGNWHIYHSSVSTDTSKYLILNSSGALNTYSNVWGAALPTSSVFGLGVGASIVANADAVAYCWSEVAGFSKFSSYTGTGSAGVTVTTGFKTKYVLIKSTSSGNWYAFDSSRGSNKVLYPDLSNAEATGTLVELTDTGFKIVTSGSNVNASGQTFIYAAYADRPGNNWTPNNLSVDDGVTTPEEATGAAPIYNTTDIFGKVKGVGFRTDSFAGTTNGTGLVLAIPGDVATDVHHSINTGSSQATVTNDGVAVVTTNSRLYGSSLELQSSNTDSLTVENSDMALGTGDLCVEFWVYNKTNKNYNAFISTRDSNGTTAGFVIAGDAGGDLYVHSNAALAGNYSGDLTLPLNQWSHVAYTRASGTHRLFLNGVAASNSTTTSRDFTHNKLRIGDNAYGTDEPVNAEMQDIRVYKGVAKYTSNFTPPSLMNATVAAGNDSLVDSPSNGTQADTGAGGEVVGNYATLNPLAISPNITPTLSNGNLEAERTATSAQWTSVGTTILVSGGKYYWELNLPTINGTIARWGVADADDYEFNRNTGGTGLPWLGSGTGTSWSMDVGGNTYHNGSTVSSSYTSTITTSDVIGIALDADANTLTFYKNGVSLGVAHSNVTATKLVPAIGLHGGTHNKIVMNFGQRAFAFSAPTNFKSLNSASLPTPTIADGSKYFDTKLWTGNSSTQTITNYKFSPNFAWIKVRSEAARSNFLFDTIRGATNVLKSDATDVEQAYSTSLTAFNSDGFDLGAWPNVNNNAKTIVGWAWDAGANSNKTYAITVANPGSGNKYYADGALQPTLTLAEGSTYKFDQSAATNSGHPLRFSTTSDGTHGGGSEYTTGVTTAGTPGSAGAYTQIVIAASAPTLYAYCTNHSGMGFQVNTSDKGGFTIPVGSLTSSAYNQTDWSGNTTATNIATNVGNDLASVFDGNFANGTRAANNGGTGTLQWSSGTIQGNVRVYTGLAGTQGLTYYNGSTSNTIASVNNGWNDLGNIDLTRLDFVYSGGNITFINAIELNGRLLINASVTPSTTYPSIASQVMASPESGFSIVTYTGVSGNQSIGHGLNAKPKFILIKNRSNSADWFAMFDTGLAYYRHGYLNGPSQFYNATDQSVSNTTITLGNNSSMFGAVGDNYVAYCFAPVAGYSAMGSYEGLGTAGGAFVYLGFRPALLIVKDVDGTWDWYMYDTARNTYNVVNNVLRPSGTNIEEGSATNNTFDFLSNGFKVRGATSQSEPTNYSGHTYIYYAVAENPFQANGGLAR